MDDNIWEYPFGDLDDEEDEFFGFKSKSQKAKSMQRTNKRDTNINYCYDISKSTLKQ